MDDDGPAGTEDDPMFFTTRDELIAWLEAHHERERELWVGLYRKGTGQPSVTWPDVVDAALCFGWIDGIRKSHDTQSYKNRITPRRKGSNWSAVNIRRIQELAEQGLVRPAGTAAFEAAVEAKKADYSYEQAHSPELGEAFEAHFRAHPDAWEYFQASAPWYRKAAISWVVSAKRDETRQRRLDTLIADSAAERRVAPFAPRKAPK